MLDRIANALSGLPVPPALAGNASPTTAGELPAVALGAQDITTQLTGIGARPAPSRRGALPLSSSFDLSNPITTFPDGSEVDLVSADRTTFFLPFGPAVASDGIALTILGASDITVAIDAVDQTVVSVDPAAGQVRVNSQLGTIEFGTALAATGQLDVAWFVGEWEAAVHRFQATLVVEIYGANAADIDSLSAAIEEAMIPETDGGIAGLLSVAPKWFGSTGPRLADAANARLRRLEFEVDAEIEDPVLAGGGGLIGQIDVDSTFGPEQFSIPVEVEA